MSEVVIVTVLQIRTFGRSKWSCLAAMPECAGLGLWAFLTVGLLHMHAPRLIVVSFFLSCYVMLPDVPSFLRAIIGILGRAHRHTHTE
jgi:hypothetical protein